MTPFFALSAGFFGTPAVTALPLPATLIVVALVLLRLITAPRVFVVDVPMALLPGLAMLLRATALIAFVLGGSH